MNKFVPLFLGALFIAVSLPATAFTNSQLVKSESSPSVYYVYNNARYAFPNEKTYFSWYSDFSNVEILSSSELAQLPLVGNVTYRPGFKMIKITTDPKVYAVSSGGVLRWVETEEMARYLYGDDWAKQIDDISDAFFGNYSIGNSISEILDYNRNVELQAYTSFTPKTDLTSPQAQNNVIADYLTCPTAQDVDQFHDDFNLWFIDARNVTDPRYLPVFYPDTKWDDYPFECNLHSTNPSRLAIYNTLKLMRDLRFSRPLPFTNDQSLYEWFSLKNYTYHLPLTSNKALIVPFIECDFYSSAATEENQEKTSATVRFHFGGSNSRLYSVKSMSKTCEKADSPSDSIFLLDGFVRNPIYNVGLWVHEGVHAINHKTHTASDDNGDMVYDRTIDEMGAWAGQFYFYAWTSLYGTNVDEHTKELAKNSALDLLNTRFTENKCPSDTALRETVNQIAPGTCQ